MKNCFPLTFLFLASCLEVRAELRTEVRSDKSGLRMLEVRMEETEGSVSDKQRSMLFWVPRDAHWTENGTLFQSTYSVGNLETGPHPLQLRHPDSGDISKPNVQITTQDWGLFQVFQYQETFRDVVQPDGIKNAILEITKECAVIASLALREFVGQAFEGSDFQKRLASDLEQASFQLGELYWQIWTMEIPDSEREKKLIHGASRILLQYGCELDSKSIQAFARGDKETALQDLQEGIARWLLKELEMDFESQVAIQKWRGLLFDGPFEDEFFHQAQLRHGGEEGVEEWFEKAYARVQGIFGPGIFTELDFEVVLVAKLPGNLLKTNGMMNKDGSTFLAFSGANAYPDGRSLDCSSIVWSPLASAIPLNGFPQDNQSAARFIQLFSLPKGQNPDPELVEIVRQCAFHMSWKPLSDSLNQLETPRRNEVEAGFLPPILDEGQKEKLRIFKTWMKYDE